MKKFYRPNRYFFLILPFFLALALQAAPDPEKAVQKLSSPRKQNSSWILDHSGILSRNSAAINRIIDLLERETSAEIAVVVLPTIDGIAPKEFATALFDHWKIGKKGLDNGLLVLHVLDVRRIEIETGYGMEGILPDATVARLLREVTIPFFKAESYSDGHLETVRILGEIIRNPEESRPDFSTLLQIQPGQHTDSIDKSQFIATNFRPAAAEDFNNYRLYLIIPIAIGSFLLLFFFVLLLAQRKRDPYLRYRTSNASGWTLYLGLALLLLAAPAAWGFIRESFWEFLPGLIAYLPLTIWSVRLREKFNFRLRELPRACAECNEPMLLLPESQEDRYLVRGQIVEESLKTKDYDVWLCEACDHTRIDIYDGEETDAASKCEQCGFITYVLIKTETIRAATRTSEGLRKTSYRCAHCGHARTVSSTIPKIPPPSSSSSSSGGWSSGGSSFGGGSSGGGGSGSSY